MKGASGCQPYSAVAVTGAKIHVVAPVALRIPAAPPCSAGLTAREPPAVKPGPTRPLDIPIVKVAAAMSHRVGARARTASATAAMVTPVRTRRPGRHPKRGTMSSWVSMAPVAFASSMTAVRADVRGAFSPKYGQSRLVALNDEMAMIKRLGTELPPDAYVLGDPVAGTAMLPFMAGLSSVWMFAGQADSDADGLYLRTHFRDLHFDPQVCEIVRRHRITHFYSDEPQRFNGVDNQALRPGLYGVDLSHGFTLVDQGGSAAVYRIDLCWSSGER